MASHPLAHRQIMLTIFSMEERLTGIISFILSALFFLFSFTQYDISCIERVHNHLESCQINASSYAFWYKTQKLSKLYQSNLSPYLSDDKTHSLLFNINLEGKKKTIPLSIIPGFGKAQKQQVSKQVNLFIKSSNTLELSINNLEPFWFKLCSFFMLLFSTYLTIKPPIIQVGASKKRQQLKITKYQLFSVTQQRVDTSLIKMVDIQYKLSKKGSRQYRLAVLLKNREQIPINTFYSAWYRPKRKVADKLNKFFGIHQRNKLDKTPSFHAYNPLHILLGLLVIGFIIAIYIESL